MWEGQWPLVFSPQRYVTLWSSYPDDILVQQVCYFTCYQQHVMNNRIINLESILKNLNTIVRWSGDLNAIGKWQLELDHWFDWLPYWQIQTFFNPNQLISRYPGCMKIYWRLVNHRASPTTLSSISEISFGRKDDLGTIGILFNSMWTGKATMRKLCHVRRQLLI